MEATKKRPFIFEVGRKIHAQACQSRHRFYITHEGPLDMVVKPTKAQKNQWYTTIVSVQNNGVANLYGFCQGDIICKPFSLGREFVNIHEWFLEAVKRRPLVVDVWRSSNKRHPCNAPKVMETSISSTLNPFVWNLQKN